MKRTKIRALLLAMCVVVCPSVLSAQGASHSVNPEALEFDTPVLNAPQTTGYRVDLFPAGAGTDSDVSVVSSEISRRSASWRDGRLRVELRSLILEVPDGQYVATITALTPTGHLQSRPSEPFVLSRPDSPAERAADARRERKWTRIGIAIGAGLLLAPFIF